LAKSVLKMHGYRVLEAANGADAIAIAREHPDAIDLLLTDVVMPGISGNTLLEQLRELRPSLRVILMSGYSEDPAMVMAAGGAYIQKPFDPDELAAKVREVLSRRS
jgi:DNA-binding response OmpR family regulator